MVHKSIEIPHPLPGWVRWIAQDADGNWWGYEHEPLQHDSGWYKNELGRNIKLTPQPRQVEWQQSLTRVAADRPIKK